MASAATLGHDFATGRPVLLGDEERFAGLYASGRSGTGKTTFLLNLAAHDSRAGHGVFFLDPHGEAIQDLLQRADLSARRDDIQIYDPTDPEYSFSINLLSCSDLDNITARDHAIDRARRVFHKLFEKELGTAPWLESVISHTIQAFIENQDYTIADIPRFLEDRTFREHLLQNVRHNPRVVDYWRHSFRPHQAESLLTRIRTLLSDPKVFHIVARRQTTLDFASAMQRRQIILLKFPVSMAPDVKRFIGAILVSELAYATVTRPEGQRPHFSAFIDEFQNFASAEDFNLLFTQARKFRVALTIAHQERFGQFADNKMLIGATDAAVIQVLFQQAPKDAEEKAGEVARAPPTETRFERKYAISETPVESLLLGHDNPQIRVFVRTYLRDLTERLEDTKAEIEQRQAQRQLEQDNYAAAYKVLPGRHINAITVPGPGSPEAAAESRIITGLQAQANTLRLSLRSLDHFLNSLMQGTVRPGQEAFAAFLTTLIFTLSFVAADLAPVLVLYIHLVCGDPARSRHIPYSLARKHGLFPSDIAAIEHNAQQQAWARFNHTLGEKWASYEAQKAAVASHRQKTKAELTERVLYQLKHWRYPYDFLLRLLLRQIPQPTPSATLPN